MHCGCIGAILQWIATYGIREGTKVHKVPFSPLLKPDTHRFARHVYQLAIELRRICDLTDTVIGKSLAASPVT